MPVPTAELDAVVAQLPLTYPIPNPTTHPNLITSKDITREEDLLRNTHSFRAWWTAITTTREAFNAQLKVERPPDLPQEIILLLGPLASPLARVSLQRLTYLYEAALSHFPNSFKLWKSYLNWRMSFVLGKLEIKKRAGGRKKFPEMKDGLEDEKEDMEQYNGGLNPAVGWKEWRALVATFERALMWLPNLPRLWLMYFTIFDQPLCPPALSNTHARRTYDRALRTLAPSLHSRIWVRFLLWTESKGGATMASIYRRYLAVDPSITERYAALLITPQRGEPRPLEAAKYLLALARKAARGEYVSPEGKSPYQLLGDWIEVVEKFSDEVGLDVEETQKSHTERKQAEEAVKTAMDDAEPVSSTGNLIRFAGPAVPVTSDGKEVRPYDEDEDPLSTRKLNIEYTIRNDGLEVYKDQAGRLWTGLATYWIKRGEFDQAKETFEKGIASVLTIKDFNQIFDAYAEFGETLMSALMESLAVEDDEDEEKETTEELDAKMKEFEELMDGRPFMVNDVLLRRNPNDVQEWEKRVALHGEDDEKVAQTYTKAIETITSRKATANLHRLYANFARFYEEGGTTKMAEPDYDSARKILEKATKVNFKAVEDLAEIWCEWAEMELRHENYDDAIRVMQRAAAIPKNTKINYHDNTLSVQARLFKSLKLWSFYVDLEEAIGTVETTKAVYDKILELRIANAQIIINYAAFLEENQYFEESFKVYERGVELFTFPVAYEIWNVYLSKFIKRYGGTKLERARDLFEQALEKCPPKLAKPLFLMYAKLEEDHGLAKRSMSILERATQVLPDTAKFEMYTVYIAKATANYGLPATRPIYQRAIEVLPNAQTAELCLRFAALERKLGEIDRARAIYAHASQFCDPRVNPNFWSEWNAFEIETGSEDTFRDMLRIKRSVQAQFNTEASYLAAQALAGRQPGTKTAGSEGMEVPQDAMALAEKQTGVKGPAFVAAKQSGPKPSDNGVAAAESTVNQNADEIHISDDDM